MRRTASAESSPSLANVAVPVAVMRTPIYYIHPAESYILYLVHTARPLNTGHLSVAENVSAIWRVPLFRGDITQYAGWPSCVFFPAMTFSQPVSSCNLIFFQTVIPYCRCDGMGTFVHHVGTYIPGDPFKETHYFNILLMFLNNIFHIILNVIKNNIFR